MPQVNVYTSDIRGAGTDANVDIEIHGDKVWTRCHTCACARQLFSLPVQLDAMATPKASNARQAAYCI
eukprot:277215-Chlamydomonas_euryale.AAC.1